MSYFYKSLTRIQRRVARMYLGPIQNLYSKFNSLSNIQSRINFAFLCKSDDNIKLLQFLMQIIINYYTYFTGTNKKMNT